MLNNTEDKRPYITTPQAAQRSGLSKTYLAKLLREGTLEGFKLGRDWIIYIDSLESFLAVPHKSGPKGPRKKTSHERLLKLRESSSAVSADAHNENGSDKS